jgi:hypothetical protein
MEARHIFSGAQLGAEDDYYIIDSITHEVRDHG